MDSILFSGCSLTYGEGLWRETGDTHQNSINQKYLIENRWLSKVSNHFGKKPISKEYNGGNNIGCIKYVMDNIDDTTKLVIFQTTQFIRHNSTINEQVEQIENMVIELENKNIPIRFIHWQWPGISEYEMSFINPKNENKLSSEIVRNRTIYILDDFNFHQLINNDKAHIAGTLANKYTLAGKLNCTDYHMNQEGHDLLAETIINYIEKHKLL